MSLYCFLLLLSGHGRQWLPLSAECSPSRCGFSAQDTSVLLCCGGTLRRGDQPARVASRLKRYTTISRVVGCISFPLPPWSHRDGFSCCLSFSVCIDCCLAVSGVSEPCVFLLPFRHRGLHGVQQGQTTAQGNVCSRYRRVVRVQQR